MPTSVFLPIISCAEADEARSISAWLQSPLAEEAAAHVEHCPRCVDRPEPTRGLPPILNGLTTSDWNAADTFATAERVASLERAQPRLALAVLLGRHAEPDAPEWTTLAAALSQDADSAVRQAALNSLAQLAQGQSTNVVPLDRPAAERVRAAGAQEALAALVDAVDDPSVYVRLGAVRALGAAGSADASAIGGLHRALSDPEAEVRAAVVDSLTTLAGAHRITLKALIERLGDDAWDVRAAAARALGKSGSASIEVRWGLWRVLADLDEDVRSAAVAALAALDPLGERELPVLVDRLPDESGTVRTAALNALTQIAQARREAGVKASLSSMLGDLEPVRLRVYQRGSRAAGSRGQQPAMMVNVTSAAWGDWIVRPTVSPGGTVAMVLKLDTRQLPIPPEQEFTLDALIVTTGRVVLLKLVTAGDRVRLDRVGLNLEFSLSGADEQFARQVEGREMHLPDQFFILRIWWEPEAAAL